MSFGLLKKRFGVYRKRIRRIRQNAGTFFRAAETIENQNWK